MLNNPNEWHNIEEEVEDLTVQSSVESEPVAPADFVKSNMQYMKLGVFLLVVAIVAGLAVFNKMQSKRQEIAEVPRGADQMANYFYDQASSSDPKAKSSDQMAVVDVNLDNSETAVSQQVSSPTAPPLGSAVTATNVPPVSGVDGTKYSRDIASPAINKKVVVVPVGNEGRENPFLPFREKKVIATAQQGSGVSFDIIEPPPALSIDEKAASLLKATISGIMYDYRSPSAIININGEDQLVRKNDRLSGFSILDITKDKVVIKSGTNIYRASVGQSITSEDVNINEVANLRNKFGGSYRPASRGSIEIKAN